jgi:hypothetical protein
MAELPDARGVAIAPGDTVRMKFDAGEAYPSLFWAFEGGEFIDLFGGGEWVDVPKELADRLRIATQAYSDAVDWLREQGKAPDEFSD